MLQHDSNLLHDTPPQAPTSSAYEIGSTRKKRKVNICHSWYIIHISSSVQVRHIQCVIINNRFIKF